jgi:tetratricopeptide (TPR) repeat protein
MSTYLESNSSDDEPDSGPRGASQGATGEPAVVLEPEVVLQQNVEIKAKGNAAFAAGDYETSLKFYSEAITNLKKNGLPGDCILHLNRSAAHIAAKSYVKALHDANLAAELDPTQWKAHWRKGVALMAMAKRQFRTKMAVKAFEDCLNCSTLPDNKREEVKNELAKANRVLAQQDAETPPADLSRCAPS